MFIKEVVEYNYSYAEYLVSDGSHELRCMCLSVPLPNDKAPKVGMRISHIFAFSFNDKIDFIKVVNVNEKYDLIIKDTDSHFQYKIRGHIINSEKAIVAVFGFNVCLGYYYPNGFNSDFAEGDFIEFIVDRFDSIIDKNIL